MVAALAACRAALLAVLLMAVTIAQVVATAHGGTGVSTGPEDVTLTVGAAVGGIKSTLVVCCGHDNTNGSAPTITTNAGTTGNGWVGPVETLLSTAAGQKMYLFYNLNYSAGSTTVRMVLSTGDDARMIVVAEITGSDGNAPVTKSNDQESGANGTDTVTSTTLTPGSQPGVLLGFSLNGLLTGTAQPTAGTGFTNDGIFEDLPAYGLPASLRVEHKAITSTSAVAATFSSTETGPHQTFAAYFAAPATPGMPPLYDANRANWDRLLRM